MFRLGILIGFMVGILFTIFLFVLDFIIMEVMKSKKNKREVMI